MKIPKTMNGEKATKTKINPVEPMEPDSEEYDDDFEDEDWAEED